MHTEANTLAETHEYFGDHTKDNHDSVEDTYAEVIAKQNIFPSTLI